MELVLLDAEIFSDSYEARLCLKRFISYALEHHPSLIAAVHLTPQCQPAWNKLKEVCSFTPCFLDDWHRETEIENLPVSLTESGLRIQDMEVQAQRGAAAWITLKPEVHFHYLVLDMLSDEKFSEVHRMKTHSDLHSFILIRVSCNGMRIFN